VATPEAAFADAAVKPRHMVNAMAAIFVKVLFIINLLYKN
jgi:hypothetical protein